MLARASGGVVAFVVIVIVTTTFVGTSILIVISAATRLQTGISISHAGFIGGGEFYDLFSALNQRPIFVVHYPLSRGEDVRTAPMAVTGLMLQEEMAAITEHRTSAGAIEIIGSQVHGVGVGRR